MRKSLSLLIIIYLMTCCNCSYAAILNLDSTDATYGSITVSYTGAVSYTSQTLWGYVESQSGPGGGSQLTIARGFVEFNLSKLYTLGISSSAVSSVIFLADGGGHPGKVALATQEDGIINPSIIDWAAVGEGIASGAYYNGLNLNVTDFVKLDIDANQGYSGFAIQSGYDGSSQLTNGLGVSFSNPRLQVEYAPQQVVPEPCTMVLFGIGGIATALLQRKKKLS